MATVDELLQKQKNRLEKMSSSVASTPSIARKKIIRTGPARPWQENLPQYQQRPLPSDGVPEPSKAADCLPVQREQTVSIASPKAYAEPLAAVSSSSGISFKDLKNTTTGEPELLKFEGISLAPEWLPVDFSPLANIGFTQTHLIQIVRQGKLTPQEVQDSIEFFAFDLNRNGLKPNGPAINFFMGILRKGIPYTPPENYESSVDEARRKTIEFKARKERERQEQIKQLVELEFTEWRQLLTAEQIAAMVPEYAKRPGQMQDSFLKTHFENEIWPEKSATVPGMITERDAIKREIDKSLSGEGT